MKTCLRCPAQKEALTFIFVLLHLVRDEELVEASHLLDEEAPFRIHVTNKVRDITIDCEGGGDANK